MRLGERIGLLASACDHLQPDRGAEGDESHDLLGNVEHGLLGVEARLTAKAHPHGNAALGKTPLDLTEGRLEIGLGRRPSVEHSQARSERPPLGPGL